MSDGRTAICPGTYDPVTNGHLDIIGRAANVFDTVVVGVVNQPTRKQTTLFTAEERKGFIDDAVSRNGLANVEVEIFSILLVELAREHGAKAIVKGLRAISDFEYEFEMNQLNRKLAPEIESDLHHRLARLQLPLLDRGQGDGDLRRRRLRPGPPGCGIGLGGAPQAVERGGQELAYPTAKSGPSAPLSAAPRKLSHSSWTSWS